MKVRVTGEYYTVLTNVGSSAARRGETREGRYDKISDAVESAMRITLDRKVGCKVQRITTHAGHDTIIGIPLTESVTGEIDIPGPRSFEYDARLSRYHPVKGWDVPDEIDPDEIVL